jgi:hypothetical protein
VQLANETVLSLTILRARQAKNKSLQAIDPVMLEFVS